MRAFMSDGSMRNHHVEPRGSICGTAFNGSWCCMIAAEREARAILAVTEPKGTRWQHVDVKAWPNAQTALAESLAAFIADGAK